MKLILVHVIHNTYHWYAICIQIAYYCIHDLVRDIFTTPENREDKRSCIKVIREICRSQNGWVCHDELVIIGILHQLTDEEVPKNWKLFEINKIPESCINKAKNW
jgi:hypothetical protein